MIYTQKDISTKIVAALGKPSSTLLSSHRKAIENNFQSAWKVVDTSSDFNGQYSEIDLRLGGTKSRNYACLWIRKINESEGLHLSGSAFAGGYGYHRPSAALQGAIAGCGISLSADIEGRGDGSMRSALFAIARDVLGMDPLKTIIIVGHP